LRIEMVEETEKQNDEEGKKPGFWERAKQVSKVGAAITITAIAGVFGGPIGAAVAIGVLAYGGHKLDERNAKNNATKDNNESRDEKSKKENTRPGFWKRALFIVGSIALGALIGGPVGIIAAAALVISDTASKGKLTEWSGDVLKAPITLVKEGYSRTRESQELSKANGVEEGAEEASRTVGEKPTFYIPEQNGPGSPNESGQQQSSSPTATEVEGQVKKEEKKSVGAPNEKATDNESRDNSEGKTIAGKEVKGDKSESILKERANSAGQEKSNGVAHS
jgi:hypothetical protein